MANVGVYPLAADTLVGQFRIAYGDVDSVPLDPVVPGYQDYTELSDDEITAFLLQGSDSVTRAIGFYYIRLSGDAAKESRAIKDYDLSVDLTKRSNDLRETAKLYFDAANEEDLIAGNADIFDSFGFGETNRPCRIELAPCPVNCGC